MIRTSALVAMAVGAILILPATCLAQSSGSGSIGSHRTESLSAGTNSAGAANTAPGMTTGSAGSLGTGTAATPRTSTDAVVKEENKTIERRLNSICRGC